MILCLAHALYLNVVCTELHSSAIHPMIALLRPMIWLFVRRFFFRRSRTWWTCNPRRLPYSSVSRVARPRDWRCDRCSATGVDAAACQTNNVSLSIEGNASSFEISTNLLIVFGVGDRSCLVRSANSEHVMSAATAASVQRQAHRADLAYLPQMLMLTRCCLRGRGIW